MKRTISSLLLAVVCTSAFAAQELAPAGFAAARQQFIAGSSGDAGARDAAVDVFHQLRAALPGHPLPAAYEGAAIALRGRDALMPWDKMKYAEKGADIIEKALAQLTPEHDAMLFNGTPESVETRVVAANTLLSLPDFMNRRSSGKRALQAALESPVLELAAPGLRASLYATAARVAADEKRETDEISYLRHVVSLNAKGPLAVKATARLKELGQ